MRVTTVALAMVASCFLTSDACTFFHFPSDNTTVIGRTMELGGDRLIPEWVVQAHPRSTVGGSGVTSLPRNKFGYVSIDFKGINDIPTVSEGMNEHGVSVSVQTFRQAIYQDASEIRHSKPAILFVEVAALLLGGASTVEDAVALLNEYVVLGNDVPTADRSHWSIVDAKGGSLVLEFTDGALRAHDNSQVAVMTNDPDYVWHLRNLNNYAALSTAWPVASYAVETDLSPNSAVPSAVGHGFNLIGMPGDYSPPSRFVKTFMLKQHSQAAHPTDDAISIATGLINTVHIVKGAVPDSTATPDASKLEFTQWATIRIVGESERYFMWRSYENMRWKRIDLTAMDLADPTATFDAIPVFDGTHGIEDVSM